MNYEIMSIIVYSSLLLIPLPFCFHLQNKNRWDPPYTWGYYISVQSILLAIYFLAVLIIVSLLGEMGITPIFIPIFLILYSLILLVTGIATLKVRKWGIILLTIFSLNPIFWVANISYIKNRKNLWIGGKD